MSYVPQPLYLFNASWPAPEIQDLLDTSYASWLARSTPDVEQTLYHYTDLQGLRGILGHRTLWLSHAFALNDPAELDYGVRLATREIDRAQERHSEGSPLHTAFGGLRTHVQTAYGVLHHPFVASFCEDGDLLSQWRGYGARGGGYALGFRFSDRTHLGVLGTDHDIPNPYLRKVLYEPDEQQALVVGFLERFAEAVTEALDGSAQTQLHPDELNFAPQLMAPHAANYLFDLSITFKHPAFAEEKEWRLLRVTRDNGTPEHLCFREARGELVPYRPVTLFDVGDAGERSFPLHEVTFGPTLNARATMAAVPLLVLSESTKSYPPEPQAISVPPRVVVRAAAAALR